MIFAGIEGGATHSVLILIKIIDNKIEKIYEEEGESLNCAIQGADATCDYILKWIERAASRLCLDLPVESVGMGLAGAGNSKITHDIIKLVNLKYSNITKSCFITTDAVAAIATAFKNGGVVLIAGTGSACRYLNDAGEIFGTGGNGHLIEESGGGFWISQRAIQTIFNHEEGLVTADYSIKFLKTIIMKHFKLEKFNNIVNLLYGPNFSKAYIASLTEKIAEATESDPLCKRLFEEAGKGLAQYLVAISRNFDDQMFENVPLLIVGSVFQSWNIMRNSFENYLQTTPSKIKHVSFYQLNCSAALGAAILAAKNLNTSFEFNYKTKEFIDEIIISPT